MSKHRDPRGTRGVQGPPGPPGKRGPVGTRGKAGAVGKRGATGPRGTIGTTGPAMRRADRLEILSVVEGQIEDIYQELNSLMQRMTQMQAQLDDLRTKFRERADGALSPPSTPAKGRTGRRRR